MTNQVVIKMALFMVSLIALGFTSTYPVLAMRLPSSTSVSPKAAFLFCWPRRCESPLWDETSKRAPFYSFGLGKRDYTTDSMGQPELDQLEDEISQQDDLRTVMKRSGLPRKVARNDDYRRFSFGLGKRKREAPAFAQQQEPVSDIQFEDEVDFPEEKRARGYAFGLGKRDRMYGFGLGKRDRMYGFGLGKKDRMYGFGLGKRDRMYGFGLGKRYEEMDSSVENSSVDKQNDYSNTSQTPGSPIMA